MLSSREAIIILQLLLMIRSFRRPLSQLLAWVKQSCAWARELTDKRLDQENMARLNLPQATWIETFLEGVTDKSTGLPLFSDLAWFVYKVSGVMCSTSVCEHYWSIEGWIHSQRRNRLDQKCTHKPGSEGV